MATADMTVVVNHDRRYSSKVVQRGVVEVRVRVVGNKRGSLRAVQLAGKSTAMTVRFDCLFRLAPLPDA